MQNKSLLYGLIGFFLGGFIVALAATTFDKPTNTSESITSMSMGEMSDELIGKAGDKYDEAFISSMIVHHEGAVAMAKLSEKNARHDEIKTLSKEVIVAQEKEIKQLKQWRLEWGYTDSSDSDNHKSMH